MNNFAQSAGFYDRFADRSAEYARYRPTYPRALGETLAGLASGRACAVDMGCGSGQLSVVLADLFSEVVAVDASAAQIDAAPQNPRIRYLVAPAENTRLEPSSADLVVAAQAFHWFDATAYWREVRRIARPGALAAVIGYGLLEAGEDVDPVIRRFHDRTLGEHWPPERWSVVAGYADIDFPFPELIVPALAVHCEWTLDELIGYLRTWTGVKAAEKAGKSPIDALNSALAPRWGARDARRAVRWPVFLRLGRIDAAGPETA